MRSFYQKLPYIGYLLGEGGIIKVFLAFQRIEAYEEDGESRRELSGGHLTMYKDPILAARLWIGVVQ